MHSCQSKEYSEVPQDRRKTLIDKIAHSDIKVEHDHLDVIMTPLKHGLPNSKISSLLWCSARISFASLIINLAEVGLTSQNVVTSRKILISLIFGFLFFIFNDMDFVSNVGLFFPCLAEL